MSKIEIRTNGSVGTIEVDGVALPNVLGYRVEHSVETIPEVGVRIFALEQHTTIAEGNLVIDGIKAPEALERALLVYLRAKYPGEHPDVVELTGLDDKVRRFTKVTPLGRGH